MPIVDESPESCTFSFPGNVYINLNELAEAELHLGPEHGIRKGMSGRYMLTLLVDDVDAVIARLVDLGVKPLTGPIDRPWGPRTVTFADPSGNYWELSS